jgi:hypothetical protein
MGVDARDFSQTMKYLDASSPKVNVTYIVAQRVERERQDGAIVIDDLSMSYAPPNYATSDVCQPLSYKLDSECFSEQYWPPSKIFMLVTTRYDLGFHCKV